ncbi:MAG: hypothetical protein H0X40_09610 [Chthoniobacterales bacterium]|nr:hypothetical protein [Chthoniobacterales bacterium]
MLDQEPDSDEEKNGNDKEKSTDSSEGKKDDGEKESNGPKKENEDSNGKENSKNKSSDEDDKKEKKRTDLGKIIGIGIIGLAVLLIIGLLYYLHARHFVSTDDAYTTGHIHEISARIAAPFKKCVSMTTNS